MCGYKLCQCVKETTCRRFAAPTRYVITESPAVLGSAGMSNLNLMTRILGCKKCRPTTEVKGTKCLKRAWGGERPLRAGGPIERAAADDERERLLHKGNRCIRWNYSTLAVIDVQSSHLRHRCREEALQLTGVRADEKGTAAMRSRISFAGGGQQP